MPSGVDLALKSACVIISLKRTGGVHKHSTRGNHVGHHAWKRKVAVACRENHGNAIGDCSCDFSLKSGKTRRQETQLSTLYITQVETHTDRNDVRSVL